MTSDVPRSRSRMPRVATLIVLTFVVAVMALFLVIILPYRRQMAAIERIEALHGIVFTEPVGPGWLRQWIGDERMKGFDRISGVKLRYEKTIAADIDPTYASLQVTPLQIENDKLITDASMEYVLEFSDVEWLDLSHTNVSDEGLQLLMELPKIEALYLEGIASTETGLRSVAQQQRLEVLVMTRTAFNDDCAKLLVRCLNLEELEIEATHVTDAGLEEIGKIKSLKRLTLNDTGVTDAGLQHLRGLTNLEELQLFNTQVTAESLREFRLARPKCEVLSDIAASR